MKVERGKRIDGIGITRTSTMRLVSLDEVDESPHIFLLSTGIKGGSVGVAWIDCDRLTVDSKGKGTITFIHNHTETNEKGFTHEYPIQD